MLSRAANRLNPGAGMLLRLMAALAFALLALNGVPATSAFAADAANLPDVVFKTAPAGIEDLRALEQVAIRVAAQVLPATVGVELGGVRASGVVVSAEGDVLTASHVAGGPGRRVTVVFPDGHRVPAETLGLNPDVDGAMVRITQRGEWPFAPIAPAEELPEPGDWCLGTGHPGSWQPDRSPPIRLGRVIESNRYVIQTDCVIMPGDSGGPLFDLQGRVIAIHSRISDEPTVNLHVPAVTFLSTWDQLRSGQVSRLAPRSRFLAQFDFDQDGAVTSSEIPEGLYRDVFHRIARQYGLDTSRKHTIEELRATLGLKVAPDRDDDNRGGFAADDFLGGPGNHAERLHEDVYTRGPTLLKSFRDATRDIRKSTVQVRRPDGKQLALGMIVGADGLVVTKFSELPRESDDESHIMCRLADGRDVSAEVVASDARDDLALLQVQASGLTAVKLGESPTRTLAQWVISPGVGPLPVSVGVLSVEARPTPPGFLGVECADTQGSPGITGIINGSAASRSSLLIRDVITHVDGKPVHTFRELGETLRRHPPGEIITLTVLREGRPQDVEVQLGPHPNYSPTRPDSMSGPLSLRRDDFSSVMQHDSVLRPSECGGPLVDLSGRLIGLNIARVDRTASYALPVDRIKAIVADLRKTEARKAEPHTGEQRKVEPHTGERRNTDTSGAEHP